MTIAAIAKATGLTFWQVHHAIETGMAKIKQRNPQVYQLFQMLEEHRAWKRRSRLQK